MSQERITDPVLGDAGRLWMMSEREEATFETEFGPTQSRVSVLVNVVNRSVPATQRELYLQLEAWYPVGVQDVFDAIQQVVKETKELQQDLPCDQITTLFRLVAIDIRVRSLQPTKCVLRYRYDTNAPDWYVVISEDYRITACGPLD